MDRTTEYAKLVVSGKKIHGRKEYLACKRHLDDLKRKKFDRICIFYFLFHLCPMLLE